MSASPKEWGVAVGMALLFAGDLWAQDTGQKFDPWGEATVAAAFEHDLAKAAQIYREIAGSPRETAEMQTKALLELGKVLRKAGMIAEAKAALKQASEGSGVAAKEAAKLLSAGTQDPDLLQVKVEKLLKQLRMRLKTAQNDLLWIGEPAASYIADAVDREKVDLEFIAAASTVLGRMGGKAVEKWAANAVKYPDVLKRRAVLKGLRNFSTRHLKISSKTVQSFLEDKEASVRRDAVRQLLFCVPANRILEKLKDPDPGVVQAARKVVHDHFFNLEHGDRRDENTDELIRIFDSAGWELVFSPQFSDTEKGRLLFLRSLRRNVLKNRGASVETAKPVLPSAEERREIIATADALGPAIGATGGSKPPGWMSRQSLGTFVNFRLKHWDHDAMPVVLKLASLHYDRAASCDFENWLVKHGTVEDIPAIARVLRWMSWPFPVLQWMAKQKVPGTALGDLQALAQWLDGLDEESRRTTGLSEGGVRSCRYATCESIAAMRTKEAEGYLVSLIRREPAADESANQAKAWQEWKDAALSALKKNGDDQTTRTLAELLVVPGDTEHARHVRYGAFETLANLQAEIAVDRYAKAYELGFESPHKHRQAVVTIDGQTLRAFGGLRLIVESRGAAPELRKGRKPYSDEVLAKIFDSCLATGRLEAFQDAAYCVTSMRLPYEAVKAIAKRALQCPDKKPDTWRRAMTLRQLLVRRVVDKYPNAPGIVQLVQGSLRDTDPEIRRLVLQEIKSEHAKDKVVLELLEKCLRDESETIVQMASSILRYARPESLIAEKDYLLAYENPYVQSYVAMALLDAKGADAIPVVGKLLLADTRLGWLHRKKLLEKMAEFRDMRAVPFLLEALKDENDEVRKAAEQELKSIRFYNEQKQLWKRLMNGTDLSAASAAEALVRQAGEGSRKDVRLTAIQSLGTLGKAETLPFLVRLMGDEDPDIRKAAKAAADKINTAKAKERVPK